MTTPVSPRPQVRAFFDRPTGSLQYVVHDPATMRGAIIDPVWNFDPASGRVWTDSAQEILDYVTEAGIGIDWLLDTHPHADHFSAAPWLAARLPGAKTGIGARVVQVQKLWADLYGDADLPCDGRQWDRLFQDGDRFSIGDLQARVMLSPGHTLASVTYVIGDAAFVHDTLMMPASGSSRADFPGGSAADLWDAIRVLLDLPGATRLYVGHDYPDEGRQPDYMATVAEHRLTNIHVKDGISREEFITRRQARDRTLPLPARMLHALQVNIRGGRLPERGGQPFLTIPVNRFRRAD
ncbi:MBL fold metallo-hydrolase [Paracoccus sp. p3-h83]|uniref:MBL fold metallo-hydrolase n=1 Tax=Paracoccus sp. p3-h83 TaxID=3342805 RepID=UPI0035B9DF39